MLVTNPHEIEYADDSEVIPRSMSVVARRLPASRPGKDSAAKYVNGTAPIVSNKKKQQQQTTAQPQNTGGVTETAMKNVGAGASEEEMISAMFEAQGEQWKQTQEHMANANPVYYSSHKKGGYQPNVPDHPPPPGYVCYRCGQKGHWIQACPTNNDPNWEGKRVRRTTGIPRSMLKTVSKPPEDADSGNYMINDEGEYVVAVADNASWQNFQNKAQAYKEAQSGKPSDPELECPLTHKLFEKPVKTPCCQKTYSDDAIQEVLLEKDFVCPNCGKEEVLLDQLVRDEEMEKRVQKYKNGGNEEQQDEQTKGEEATAETGTEGKANENNDDKNLDDDKTNGNKRKRDSEGEEENEDESKKAKTDENNENQQQQPNFNNMPFGMMPPMPPFMPPMMGMPFPFPMPMMNPNFMMQMQNQNNQNLTPNSASASRSQSPPTSNEHSK